VKQSIKNAPVEIGEVLAGKYRVERVLGVGGMGVVVAATHLQLDKLVALKFMLEEASEDPEIVARFAREAKAAARLHTLHICKVLDVGALENGAPYMVMEFLEGSDLRKLMKERKAAGKGPMPTARAVGYIVQACLGMAEAHAHGFVHRDLKPPNLFLTGGADGRPLIKILDFGIAKASLDGIDTSTETVMGSPSYMPPEQWEGARYVDERGDIWALGAILHFLLAGRPPFQGDSLPVLFNHIATREPGSLALPELGVPQGLQAAVRRCLEKSPGDRPQSAAELANLLAPFGSHDAQQFAMRASRVASVGPEGTLIGQVGHSTGIQALRPEDAVTLEVEQSKLLADPTTIPDNPTTIPDSGTIHHAAVLPRAEPYFDTPRAAQSRKWLLLYALGGVAIAIILFASLADDHAPRVKAEARDVSEAVALPVETVLDSPRQVPQPALMAEVTLSTLPEGAEIRVNGVPKGMSPLTISLEVGSTVWLRFDLDGHEALEQSVEIASEASNQEFSLVALTEDRAVEDRSERDEPKTKRAPSKTRVLKSRKPRKERIRDSADRRH
jgi:serine/threonine-protein kinase